MCQFVIYGKNSKMNLKFAWNSFFVICLCIKENHAYTYLKCDQIMRSENCTLSNIQADKVNPSFDFSSFNENSYDYHYGYSYRKTIVKYIKFIDSTLYELPNGFFTQLPNIAYLSAPNCSITNISKSEFDSANHLLKLVLPNNMIEIINHMVFWGASRLLELNLASNRIAHIRETAFYNLGQLIELNLANNRIAEVKSELFRDLKSLKFISLAYNEIASIDSDLFDNNVLLEIVRLHDNKIVSVGEAFLMQQSGLKFLYLQNNSIEALDFKKLQAVTINLHGNKLQELQINANTLRIFASNNQISNLTVEDSAKITHLYVTSNQITDITPIAKLSTLQYLDLSGNMIGAVNLETFAALNGLISLGLKYTNITNLEYGTFSHLPDLTDLDISYNSLKKIDLNIFTSLTSLEKLALDGNDLTEISYEDIKHTFPKLKSISLSDNNWNCTYLTAMIKKMNSGGVEIKIDPAKFVRNSTNQKGIACQDTKNQQVKHWRVPLLETSATDGFNATAYAEEMSKTIDKLIASINSTDIESLKEQITQFKGRLEYLEKKLTDQEMKLVKTQLQISTANSTQQTQNLGNIHTLIDQLNNLTLQRQQLNSDVLSQKIYELNYNMERNVKNLARLEAMVKAKDSGVDMDKGYRVYQAAQNDVRPEQGSMAVINVFVSLITIIVALYCGFKVMVYYKSRQKRRLSAFSNRTSTVTLEHSI